MLPGRADQGGAAMQVRAILLVAVLALAPLGVRAADLVVWWEEGFYPGEDDAVREMMTNFEKKTESALAHPPTSRSGKPMPAP
jgi:hypothetical protein